MRKLTKQILFGMLALAGALSGAAQSAEWNPVRQHGEAAAPAADRIIVAFKATDANSVLSTVWQRAAKRQVQIRQAQTTAADAEGLAGRAGLATRGSRQLTPSMHVLFLRNTLRGAEVGSALGRLRADQAVEFAEVDQRRYVHAAPNDPLFVPSAGATGQWFMLAPTATDVSAVDALDAWAITTGSTGIVIADVDSGFRFDHPDLLRAGLGGRLLPGYDFVGEDLNKTNGNPLGTFLIANDGDGWDPDPSDPGDWINASDQMNSLFPSADCPVSDSSWHGTRVAGVLGAITDNGVGVAGMNWASYILPVRGLGKCGGYDSDIITGIQWAAGLHVSGVTDNPYPADIINLSLGGTGSCPTSYKSVVTTLTNMGVLVVASAGNENGPVDSPGNCPGVLAVAGLRNVGTKVGYSSFGAEVGIAAPAGNCVNTSGPCLRSLDTTVNQGLTVPGGNGYTDQTNPNLGTSFSAPIVSATAALMRAVNGNLTPAQLIARIRASATAFPAAPAGSTVPTCPTTASPSGECVCVVGQCGAGMLNTFNAVKAAQKPIAAIQVPAVLNAGTYSFDAGASGASCGRTLQSYQWTGSAAVTVQSSANGQATVVWTGSTGTLTLLVTDSSGDTDTAVVNFSASTHTATSTAPAAAGSAANACPASMTMTVAPPTIAEAFSPTSIATTGSSTLTLTFNNSNPFALTQSSFSHTLPSGLAVASSPAAATTCAGFGVSVSASNGSLSLSQAIIPANASCTLTVTVQSTTAGTYADTVAANSLNTGPAGANTATASASLDVTSTTSSSGTGTGSGGGGGGGRLELLDVLFIAGVLFVGVAHRIRPQRVRLKVRERR